MTALIDADSLIYIIGYNHKDHIDNPAVDTDVQRNCDEFVKTILTLVQADNYIGVFTPKKNFRYDIYKYAKYKGERPPKPDWFERFAPVIKGRLEEKWGFITVPDLEADDVICALAEYYSTKEDEWIICSPDKDLRQIAGLHYDYKKEGAIPIRVSTEEAHYNFWLSMLTGDDSDNVKGIPGLGIVKASKIFKDCEDTMQWGTIVMMQYAKYFGQHYGPIIYQETKDTLQLMCSRHRLWCLYGEHFDKNCTSYSSSTDKWYNKVRPFNPEKMENVFEG